MCVSVHAHYFLEPVFDFSWFRQPVSARFNPGGFGREARRWRMCGQLVAAAVMGEIKMKCVWLLVLAVLYGLSQHVHGLGPRQCLFFRNCE